MTMKLLRIFFIFLDKYMFGQNHGKQVFVISCIKFHLLTFQFVVIPNGKRDLSSLPDVGESADANLIMKTHGNPIFPGRFSKPAFRGFV